MTLSFAPNLPPFAPPPSRPVQPEVPKAERIGGPDFDRELDDAGARLSEPPRREPVGERQPVSGRDDASSTEKPADASVDLTENEPPTGAGESEDTSAAADSQDTSGSQPETDPDADDAQQSPATPTPAELLEVALGEEAAEGSLEEATSSQATAQDPQAAVPTNDVSASLQATEAVAAQTTDVQPATQALAASNAATQQGPANSPQANPASQSTNAAPIDTSTAQPVVVAADTGSSSTTSDGETQSQAKPDQTAQIGKPLANAAATTQTTAALPADTGAAPTVTSERVGQAQQTQAPLPTPASQQNDTSADRLNEARLARGLSAAVNQKGGSVTLRLTPAEMGTVRIQLQMNAQNVSAQFTAETPGARTMLQQQMNTLRTALEAQGLTVDRLSVQSTNNTAGNQFNQRGGDESPTGDERSRGQYAQDQQSSGGDQSRDERDGTDFRRWFDSQTTEAFALNEQE